MLPPFHAQYMWESFLLLSMLQNLTWKIWFFSSSVQTVWSQTLFWCPPWWNGRLGPCYMGWCKFQEHYVSHLAVCKPLADCLQAAAFRIPPQVVLNPLLVVLVKHWVVRVRHDWATSLSLFTFMHWRRKWQPTPVFLPGESHGRRSLLGCRLWDRTESDTTEAT